MYVSEAFFLSTCHKIKSEDLEQNIGMRALEILFTILLVLAILLVYNVYYLTQCQRDIRQLDQENIIKASSLLIQSTTQTHALYSLQLILESKFIVSDIITRHGGVYLAERKLNMHANDLETLKLKIDEQYSLVSSHIINVLGDLQSTSTN